VELADMTIKLKDIVSDETLRSQLPFVTDLEKEAKLVEEQKQKEQEMTLEMKMFPSASESNDPQGNGTNNNGQNTHNLQKTATKE
jgi:hypothetical protein